MSDVADLISFNDLHVKTRCKSFDEMRNGHITTIAVYKVMIGECIEPGTWGSDCRSDQSRSERASSVPVDVITIVGARFSPVLPANIAVGCWSEAEKQRWDIQLGRRCCGEQRDGRPRANHFLDTEKKDSKGPRRRA